MIIDMDEISMKKGIFVIGVMMIIVGGLLFVVW